MHKYKYYFTRKVNVSFVLIILILSLLSSIMLFTIPVRACPPKVGTFESDYVTSKTAFLQGEIVYGQGTNNVPEHLKLRIRDPSDNVTYSSNPVYGKKITCSWVLDENAPMGRWDIQRGRFYEGSWHWEYTAYFDVITIPEYTMTININGLGKVTKDLGQGTYTYGTLVNLTATASPGWTFDRWSGDLNSSNNPETINMTKDKIVYAYFEKGSNNGGDTNGGGTNGKVKKIDSGNNDVENHPPIANISVGDLFEGFVNSEIIFNGSLSYDPDGYIISWEWNFGDGSNGRGEITTHSYPTAGTYTVILTVTDDKGATNISENPVFVIQSNNSSPKHEINDPVISNRGIGEPERENSALFILSLLALIPVIALLVLIPSIFFIMLSRRNKEIGKVRRKKTKHKK